MAAKRSSWRVRLVVCLAAIGMLVFVAAASSMWNAVWTGDTANSSAGAAGNVRVVAAGGSTEGGDVVPLVLWTLAVVLVGSVIVGRAWRWWRSPGTDAPDYPVVDPSELRDWSPVAERTDDAPGGEVVQLPEGVARRRARRSQHG